MNKDFIKNKLKSLIQFLIPFIIVIVIWELIVYFKLIGQLPAPSAIYNKFVYLTFENNVLTNHISGSLYRLIIGYILAIILGIFVGSIISAKKIISDMFTPLLSLLIAIPTIAWVPVLLITLGLGDETVIAAVFLGGFFAITYSTIHGIKMVDKSLINAAKISGVKKTSMFIHIFLPGSLVSLIPGLRLAIGYSWRALVGAEMLAAMVKWGVGKMIYTSRFWNDIETMFLGLVIIGIGGLLLDQLLMRYIERVTIERWGMVSEG
jgi:NitT/TauT family transport system permease protein